jgi:hypothetical protein
MAFTHTKKLTKDNFLRPGSGSESGSDQEGPDLTGSGFSTLVTICCPSFMDLVEGNNSYLLTRFNLRERPMGRDDEVWLGVLVDQSG